MEMFFKEYLFLFFGLIFCFPFLFSVQHVRLWYESQSGVWDEQLVIKQHLQWHRLVCLLVMYQGIISLKLHLNKHSGVCFEYDKSILRETT